VSYSTSFFTLKIVASRFETSAILYEINGGHNTASVVFFLILYSSLKDININTGERDLDFSNEKVLFWGSKVPGSEVQSFRI
jgi:hypothetical protein